MSRSDHHGQKHVKRDDELSSRVGQDQIVWRAVADLHPSPNNSRLHPQRQVNDLVRSIRKLGMTMPIMVDEKCRILIGHGRFEAAIKLGWARVPTVMRTDLSEADKRALMIADNRIAEKAIWDLTVLNGELKALIDLDYDVELTGFTTGEIDLLLDGKSTPSNIDPADQIDATLFREQPKSARGDLWQLGPHRLLCGDALEKADYDKLMLGLLAELVVTDAPYNVPVMGHARGRGKQFREFAMASGEMSDAQFELFLRSTIERLVASSTPGSIHYLFMDWRHLPALLHAGKCLYSEWKQLLVWNKSNAGQGSFYRSKHELIAVFKNGTDPHINNFGLGAEGRYRTNVLDYPGGSSPDPNRREQMDLHPTVKPVALISDLIRDCSRRKGIVLDPFAGSGTILLAAERTGRVARAIEIDPQYVDVAIQRWEAATGRSATLSGDGRTFGEIRASARRPSATNALPSSAKNRASPRRCD